MKVWQTRGSCHRDAVLKAAGNHVRLAEAEEQLPWHDLDDSLRDTGEQAYVDLCPAGASRDPRCEGPPTSSDVPMTPPPVPGDSVPDVTADEPMPVPDVTADEPMPDTSEFPVPNSSVYAPARNPRVRWRSDALERPTP